MSRSGPDMKYALVNGERHEAQSGLSGTCPTCDRPVVAKCGEVRIWHWAHLGRRCDDHWQEPETEWHRAWKGHFPVPCQEVVLRAATGEKHRADVKTDRGWVIEFQYSFLKPEERRSRDAFYPKLIWVVNGTRRKRDRAQLLNAWNHGGRVAVNSPVRKVFSFDCALLKEWAGSHAPVFFDLGEPDVLWWLIKSTDGSAYVHRFSRAEFIGWHLSRAAHPLDEFVSVTLPRLIADYEADIRAQALQPASPQTLERLRQHFARRGRHRGRF